jgi:hypothetical protein
MFAADVQKAPIPRKGKSTGVLWVEAIAFSLLIVLSWLTELLRFPHLIYGEDFHPNWTRAFLRTLVIVLIWVWVYLATRQLLKRLHYLEEFVRVCSWCRNVCHDGHWLPMEKFLNSQFETKTTHGMCPDCLKKQVKDLQAKNKAAAAAGAVEISR